MSIEKWNARYRAGEAGTSEPSPLLVQAARALVPGRALDLACGSGCNAQWLARHGWHVVAVDGSPVAIEIVRSLGEPIDARVHDLERDPLPFDDDSFDLVCIFFFLHRPLFDEVRRIVRPGGLFVGAIHTIDSAKHSFVLDRGELRSHFRDWSVLHDREANGVAEIVARK